MAKIMKITLILSLLLLSRAIDLGKWELFAEDTKEISIRRLRMGRLRVSGGTNRGFPLQIFDRTTQAWVDFSSHRGTSFKIGLNDDYWFNTGGRLYWKARNSPHTENVFNNCFPSLIAVNQLDDKFLWYTGSPSASIPSTNTLRRLEWNGELTINLNLVDVVSLASEPVTGNIWAVKSNGDIFRFSGINLPRQKYGKAKFITFGRTIDPYIVSQEVVDGGFAIKKWNALLDDWETIPGIGGVSVTLDDDDNLYVVTNDNKVYRQKGIISVYCPMCDGNWGSYGGVCSSENNQCLNCPAGSYAVDSPLRCEPCPSHCKECSSATTCTACPVGQYLISDGTCLAACDPPLDKYTEAGKDKCRGPCAIDPAGSFFYPSDQSCHPTCEAPIVDPTSIYESCEFCSNKCEEWFDAQCQRCSPPCYRALDRTCVVQCDPSFEKPIADPEGFKWCLPK